MRNRSLAVAGIVGVIVAASWALLSAGQLLLAPVRTHGRTVTPVYEGWYPNPDGTISVSWGHFNRNSEESVRIPLGADNRIEPGGPDRGQPTVFLPRRHRGVFTVVVPADFGDDEVLWTLAFRGDTQTIPGHLHRSTRWAGTPAATRRPRSSSPRTAASSGGRAARPRAR